MPKPRALSRNAQATTALLVLLILSSVAWNVFVQLRELDSLEAAALIGWIIFLFAVPLILIALVGRELLAGFWLSFFYGIIFTYLSFGTVLIPQPSECCTAEARTIAAAGGVVALLLVAFAWRGVLERKRRRR